MTARGAMAHAFDALLDFGHVVSTSLASTTRQVLAVISGSADDDEGTNAEQRTSPLWGHAAILFRPKAPTSSPSGRLEVAFVRNGDELVPVASRDLRWTIDLEEGDVVVRNLDGTKPVRLHLKADGTAILEADTVKIGDSGATEKIGLGTAIKTHLDNLKTNFDAHTHAAGTYSNGAGAVTGASGAPIVPSPSVPDVESRHLVEN